MSDSPAQRLTSRRIFDGRVIRVEVDRVRLPHGPAVEMEIVRHPGSVVLLVLPEPGRVYLVRQYRYAIGREVWELPAGSLERGEEAEEAARRECHEEIGLLAAQAEPVGRFYPTPGYCDEVMLFYRLTGLAAAPEAAVRDPDEHLEVRIFSIAAARELVRQGGIEDMKTAVGLTLL
jgi:ADP-ribose pyrophosphatase